MDAISENANLIADGKGEKLSRVVVYLVDNGTSGPVARAAKISHELSQSGADVTILMPKRLMGSKLFATNIKQVPYDAARMWKPSRLNPQWQIAKIRPDLLVVDEYPFVSNDHARTWESVIDIAKRMNHRCKVHGMSCDIPIYYKDTEAENLPARAKRMDHIWVTGDSSITDIGDYVADTAKNAVMPKVEYAGFMDSPSPRDLSANVHTANNTKEIVVYLGGMNLSKLANRYLSLIANIPLLNESMRDAKWRFIMPENGDMGAANKIATAVSHLPESLQENISIEPADEHFKDKLANAAMVVTGGGQSAIESVLVQGKPTVILPGFFGDQFVRAKDLAARFPEQVAASDLPTLRIPPMTAKRLRFNMISKIEEKDWLTQTFEWAEASPECKKMRDSFEKIFAASDSEHPRPKIMLDGAQRIARHVLADTWEVRAKCGATPSSSPSRV